MILKTKTMPKEKLPKGIVLHIKGMGCMTKTGA
jgi:hypothetical protein